MLNFPCCCYALFLAVSGSASGGIAIVAGGAVLVIVQAKHDFAFFVSGASIAFQ